MSTASTTASTANPTRGRWGLVVAALLMQLSLGAVYAWSVFSSALQKAEAFKLTKPEATLPVRGRHRDDLHRHVPRRPDPGPPRPARPSP